MLIRKVLSQNWSLDEPRGLCRKRSLSRRAKSSFDDTGSSGATTRRERIRLAVRQAMSRLTVLERDTIERFYFHGESILEISIVTGRRLHRVRSAHDRAMRKLRRQLAGFVRKEFGLIVTVESDCPVCNSRHRKQIEALLQQRSPTASLQSVLDKLATEFDLPLKTSTVLIRHEKYH